MIRKPRPPRRIADRLAWTLLALVLPAAPTEAASPAAAPPTQQQAQLAQTQAEPAARRQPAQEVSDALGQRLDQMVLTSKPPMAR